MTPHINITETGINIKQLMDDRGLTARDVSKACRFATPQAVYKWVRGVSVPTVDNLVILADLFGVRIDDILVVERD